MNRKTLADVCMFVRNGLSAKQRADQGGLPVTRIETISTGLIDPARVGYAGIDAKSGSKWLLERGDILFSHINSPSHIGKVAIYEGDPARLIHGMNLLCLRPNRDIVDPWWLRSLIRNPSFIRLLQPFVNRAVNQASISIANLCSIQFDLPPLDEQRRIAAILDRADALRAKRHQALAHLDSLTQSIFHDMFSEEPLLPVRAGELMPSMRNGLSPAAAGEYPADVLTLSAVTQGTFDPTAVKPGLFAVEPPADKRVAATDFLMCRGNGNKTLVGVGTYSPEDRTDLVFPDTVIAGRIDTSKVTMPFLSAAWRQQQIRHQIESLARTTNGTHKVNQKALSRVTVPLPPIGHQREFADRVEQVDARRAAVKDALAADDKLFASLQARAFRDEL